MEEKLFNPVPTATPGKSSGKSQSMFKSTHGKPNCLTLFSAVIKIAFRLNLILNQMYDIVYHTVALLLDLNCTVSQL